MSVYSAITVFLGAGIGGVLRWFVSMTAARWFGYGFPWGTLIVNVSGSAVMGLLAGFFLSRTDAGHWQTARLFMMTGVLGGYTTFSSFSLEAIALWEEGQMWAALGYSLGSVVLAFAGLVIGLIVMRSWA
ncbi:fluoride efflux transporter CrcB [Pseudochelatococcus sp. G4_1912]|uniref:fluoride efflux transporter CrcB n=1 Tax=Pseudochelatococcus sp. G4_1912 TaxID=3114288 RepID=UPI0039C729BC